jgi:hypothetical protein
MLLTYFLNDFEIVLVAPIITGITLAFTFHMSCISIARSSYFIIYIYLYIIYIYTLLLLLLLHDIYFILPLFVMEGMLVVSS